MTRNTQPCSGVSAINPVAIEKFRIVMIMTLRRADLVGQPAIEQRAERRTDAGGQQDRPRLPIGKVPVLYDERQNERDQEKIEEIEHVADRRCGEDLPLIDCQLLLLLQIFEHDACLPPRLIAPRLTRRQVWADIPRTPPPTSAIVWFLGVHRNRLRPLRFTMGNGQHGRAARRRSAYSAADTVFCSCVSGMAGVSIA